jgi:hypothetical protein
LGIDSDIDARQRRRELAEGRVQVVRHLPERLDEFDEARDGGAHIGDIGRTEPLEDAAHFFVVSPNETRATTSRIQLPDKNLGFLMYTNVKDWEIVQ